MNVYTTFEWLNNNRKYAQQFAETFDTLPVQMCLNVEYTPIVKEVTCEITVGEEEQ